MKRLLNIVLVLFILLSNTKIVFAQTTASISGEDKEASPGDQVSVFLYGNDFNDIGALDVNIYYDSEVLKLDSVTEADFLSSAQHFGDINKDQEGQIITSYIFTSPLNGSGKLFELLFTVNENAKNTDSTVTVLIGDVCDSSLNPVEMKGSTFHIKVNENEEVLNKLSLFSNSSITLEYGKEAEISLWTDNAYGMAATDLLIEYDSEKLEYIGLELGEKMLEAEGASDSISERSDCIVISYINLKGINGNIDPILKVKFRSKTENSDTTTVRFTAESLYDASLKQIEGSSVSVNVKLDGKQEQADKYVLSAVFKQDAQRNTVISYTAPGASNLAAADFILDFDKDLMQCLEVRNVSGSGSITSNIKNDIGQLKFSYINDEGGLKEDCSLFEIVFQTKNNACVDIPLQLNIKNPVDDSFGKLDMECEKISFHMHKYNGEPDYLHDVVCEVCGEIVYERLTPERYIIHFDANGGKGQMEDQVLNYGVPEKLSKNLFTRNGYTFNGWICEDETYEDEQEVSLTGQAKEDQVYTFKADWKLIEYSITYDLDGGSLETMNPSTYTIESDDIILNNPTKTGYVFTGWSGTDIDGLSMEVVISKGSVGDRSYKANYRLCDYQITYVLNDSQGSPASHFNPDGYSYDDETIVLKDAARIGYIFEGWYKDPSFNEQVKEILHNSSGDITLYAKWTPVKYTVHFDMNGLSASLEDIQCVYDEPFVMPDLKSDTYHEILGWSDSSNGEVIYKAGEEVRNLSFKDGEIITLYCIYDYKYQAEMPDVDVEDEEVKINDLIYLSSPTPGSYLFYTTDGSEPSVIYDEESGTYIPQGSTKLYDGAIKVDVSMLDEQGNLIIKVISVLENFKPSDVLVLTFAVNTEEEFGDISEEDRKYQGIETAEDIPEGIWTSRICFNGNEQAVYDPNVKAVIADDFRVYYGSKLLSSGTDYTIKYLNNTKAEEHNAAKAPSIVITGKGNYVGTLVKTFDILPLSLSDEDVLIILKNTSFLYNSKIQKPVISSVEYKGIKLKNKTDYTADIPLESEKGIYDIAIKLDGNYKGTLHASYSIVDAGTFVSSLKINGIKAKAYDHGNEIRQELSVSNGKITLKEGQDYTVEYKDNTNAGTAYIIIKGIEEAGYYGEVIKSFKITPMAFTNKTVTVSGLGGHNAYTGDAIKPEVKLSYGGRELILNEDYTLVYKNNIKAGKASITLTGKNNYKGSFSATFVIDKVSLNDPGSKTEVLLEDCYYEKGGVKPLPEVLVNGEKLIYNVDYTLSYKNNSKPGQALLTVKGKGSYVGSLDKNFNVLAKPLNISKRSAKIDLLLPDKVYAEKADAWKSKPVLTDSNGKKLSAGTDYSKEISYTYVYDTLIKDGSVKEKPELLRHAGEEVRKSDILPVDALVRVTINTDGLKLNYYTGSISGTYRIVSADISKANVIIPVQYYTGSPIYPDKSQLTVKLGNQILKAEDYDIIGYTNNTAKGTAKLTIKGKGNYGGIKTVSFKIAQRSFGMTIRFMGNGATAGSMRDQLIYKDSVLIKNTYKRIEVINGVKKTYTFKGWNSKADGTGVYYKDGAVFDYSIFKAGSITTLYAIWE